MAPPSVRAVGTRVRAVDLGSVAGFGDGAKKKAPPKRGFSWNNSRLNYGRQLAGSSSDLTVLAVQSHDVIWPVDASVPAPGASL